MRSAQTVEYFSDEFYVSQKTTLVQMNPGICGNMNTEQVQIVYPEEWQLFTKNPFYHRSPRAEVKLFLS